MTSTSKKVTDTATANENTAPENGYVIATYEDGRKCVYYRSKGCKILENEVFHSEPYETVCALAGVDFNPVNRNSFNKDTLDEFARREKSIKNCDSKIGKSLEKIAFDIYWINARKAYLAAGYYTIVDYAECMFGYGKTTCYSFISIVDRFAKRDENGAYLEEFDPVVKGYSVSKLSYMTGLTNEQISKEFKPAMSVRDIRAAVKALSKNAAITEKSEDTDDLPDSVQDKTGAADPVEPITREAIHNTIISYKGAEDYMKNADYQHISSLVMRVINAHPDAVIELSYTLPLCSN